MIVAIHMFGGEKAIANYDKLKIDPEKLKYSPLVMG